MANSRDQSRLIHLRPFQPGDWGVLLELANQAVPFAPEDNQEWLRQRRDFDESARTRRQYLALRRNTPIGYGCLEQQSEGMKRLRTFVVCHPDYLRGEVGSRLFDRLLRDAARRGATHLWAREFQQDEPIRHFFTERSFEEVERITLPGIPPMVVLELILQARAGTSGTP
jgi:N-acetylglutamate synthase-like GNAT family acetyltransferase